MAPGPIISWAIDGETKKRVTYIIFLDSRITVDGGCSLEIKRLLLHGRKAMTNLDGVLERAMTPTPVLLPGGSHGRRSLVAAVHGVVKSWTRLSDFTFTFHFHALEKEMATHSSVLAWRIPGLGEPGRLPSVGSHRVGHN